ncbi:MAG TPA: PQQ-binding-like beta-propeller repeat protein [Tepidisphaeraceae bacterium]|nr:PQQ-binding-like beta-propeller repeat protein [Tepidisphaeraceae bacterium]
MFVAAIGWALVCSSTVLAAAGTGKSNWPAFHDGGPLRGVAEPIGGPPMHVRWTFRAQDDPAPAKGADESGAAPAFESSVAIVDGTVYAADRSGALRAIDLKTGKRKWTYRSEAGFEASPAVVNGVVYIGDEDGVFHAVKADSGVKLWTFDSGSSIHSSTNFLGDKIVFGTDGADIFCLNAADGKKLWDAKAGDRVNGSPAISPGENGKPSSVFVSGCDAELRSINLTDGKEIFAKEMGALCPGSPAVLPDKIIVGTDGGKVICLSGDGQKQLWEFAGVQNQAMVYSSPAADSGIVVVGARDRNVYGLELATGKKLWSFPTRGDVDSSPVISGGRVYVGSKDKHLYVLDLKTGRKLWDFVATRGIVASPAIAEGVLVIGDTGGSLFCLEPGAHE